MPRPVTKKLREREIMRAALEVVADDEHGQVSIVAVARRMGLTPNAIRYYYRDNDELAQALLTQMKKRFLVRRLAELAELDDPRHQLIRAIELGLPTGPDDLEWRAGFRPLLAAAVTPESGAHASDIFAQQTPVYREVLAAGAEQGLFTLRQPAEDIAVLLLSMEDYLGLRITMLDPAFDRATALRLMRDYAELATACVLPQAT